MAGHSDGVCVVIRYSLTCEKAHEFESWFQSADAFDRLSAAGHVSCVTCGSTEVSKSLMSPSVSLPRDGAKPMAEPGLRKPANPVEEAFAAMRRHVEENSEYVGMNFAAEARAIHDGDAPTRSIYGETRSDEARRLIEDGIPVAPLPFLPTRRTN
jgi:hypothetical protein